MGRQSPDSHEESAASTSSLVGDLLATKTEYQGEEKQEMTLPGALILPTRVRVQDIGGLAEIQGKTPDQIAEALPHLTLGQIHAALSYYFDHREAILTEMRQDQDFAQQLRAAHGAGPLERRLKSEPVFASNAVPS